MAAMIPALYMIAVVDELVNAMKADARRRGDWKGGRDTINGETFERPKTVAKKCRLQAMMPSIR